LVLKGIERKDWLTEQQEHPLVQEWVDEAQLEQEQSPILTSVDF
jgi:hypothetical protein